jgi:3-hydroxyisobutyrate dehydrogenase
MSRVDAIGLGVMGWPMAARLAAAGHAVLGIDGDADVQARWRRGFGAPEGPAEVVLCCVTDEAASRAAFGTVFHTAAPGTLLIDHSTTSDAWAREADVLARAAGLHWCDAPLSGGALAAADGNLVAMAGLHAADLPRVRELLRATTREVVHLGPPGSGQLGKMANQHAIAGVAAGLAEVQAFSRSAGLELAQVFHALRLGSASSVQLERLLPVLAAQGNVAADTFAWLDKDLALCEQASPRSLPLVQLWRQLWKDTA